MRTGLIALSLILSGCQTYSTQFECPVGEGIKCASLSTVNRKMDKGQIDTSAEDKDSDQSPEIYFSPSFKNQLED